MTRTLATQCLRDYEVTLIPMSVYWQSRESCGGAGKVVPASSAELAMSAQLDTESAIGKGITFHPCGGACSAQPVRRLAWREG